MTNTENLSNAVSGPVLRPGEDGYDEGCAGFQAAYQHRPAMLVGATSAEDVRAAVEFAARADLPVAVQATGHGLATAADGGVLISTRRIDEIRIDPAARTAWLGAGVTWQPVIERAAEHGLAPLSGSAPHVGAVSYTLGGGLSLLARKYGYAADHVRRLEVVTPDGTLREVGPDHELFGALLGGRDNFGVVTGLEIGLVPVERIYGGNLTFDADLVPDALRAWREWTETVPEEMTSGVSLIELPDIPQVPGPLRGRYTLPIRIVHIGDKAEGERLVAPLRAIGTPLSDTLSELPFTESASIHNDPADPHGYDGDGVLLSDVDGDTLVRAADMAGPGAAAWSMVQFNHLGGALSRKPSVPTAVGGRDARYLARVLSGTEGVDAAAIDSVHSGFLDVLAPRTLGRSLNFVFGERVRRKDTATGFDEDTYRRLGELKAKYDPANRFRFNRNIEPVNR